MDKLIRERKPLRATFTRLCTQIDAILAGEQSEEPYGVLTRSLIDKFERLQEVQARVLDFMIHEGLDEQEYDGEFETAEKYRERYVALKTKLEDKVAEGVASLVSVAASRDPSLAGNSVERVALLASVAASRVPSLAGNNVEQAASLPGAGEEGVPPAPVSNLHLATSRRAESLASADISGGTTRRRRFKLPPLKLKNFSGEAAEWLGFWGQYKQIHEDDALTPEDKFQYLSQSMVPGSKAGNLVDSYPPTAENYPVAIQQLKERYAREDVLVEVYVRQLLGLVMENAQQGRAGGKIHSLYDRLESYLRALETLGKTKDKFAEFLTPMVESCLPEGLLRLWQRSRNSLVSKDSASTLGHLMEFLKREVQGEERIAIVTDSFGCRKKVEKTEKGPSKKGPKEPTAAALVAVEEKQPRKATRGDSCAFCDKKHRSQECFLARKMSEEERKRALLKGNHCYICMQSGHQSRACKAKVSCIICQKRHYPVMCSELNGNKTTSSE